MVENKMSAAGVPKGPRPRRGSPEQTRARLICTAAEVFNRVPYWETDSNQLAKAAGYSMAGEHQIDGAKTALGHAYGGGAQFYAMWVVSSDQP